MLKVVYINQEFRPALESAGLLAEEVVLEWARSEHIIKRKNADLFRDDIKGIGRVYIKKYYPKRKFLSRFRKSYTIREYNSLKTMANLSIPQPEPVFIAVIYDYLWRAKCGMSIMREVENSFSLDKFLAGSPDEAALISIGYQLVQMLNTMHNGNFCHWDFKPRNILITPENDTYKITPIDSRSGKRLFFFNRYFYSKRDYRYLLKEPLLKPVIEGLIYGHLHS
ncbi:MAG: lipopolysaccharide kinase InaA family protein [Planctomycetota bacterium]|jgi:tRNA A-37 threonylcarbamoyl transferase component Bud32